MPQVRSPIHSITDLEPADHACCIYDTDEEHRNIITPFLTLHREGSDYLLIIADNGTGMPGGIDVTRSPSLGLYLIRFIVKHQLRGSLEISTAGGTAYTIRFPDPAVKERHADV
jgi:two-component sensor histidine kinase